MGKTTLAKLICDDDRVTRNFLVVWIGGIHEDSYAESVVKRMILESVTKKKKKLEDKDEDLILEEAMSGSRFLLVLDDFRSENLEEWLRLRKMLREAARSFGGAVLVTTQNYLAANVVDSRSHTWRLQRLGEEDSWTIFEEIIGGDSSESKTRDVKKKLVNKCSGVPGAIATMARILRSREAINESEIDHLEEEFMQETKLMYYDELPSWHLKQCFAYLPLIFSVAYSVEVETLVRLWMAEGFLGPVNSNSSRSSQQPQPEDLGLDCIKEFCRRSILYVQENEYGSMTHCWMENQLLHELSRFVAGKGRFYIDDGDESVNETVRRVLLAHDVYVSNGIPESLNKIKKNLRTILFPVPSTSRWPSRIPHDVTLNWSACDAIFRAFSSLRVLSLANLGMRMLPISIGELKSLRYLDLSHNNVKKLPTSIGKLKHLQTLIMSHCHQLRELPNEMKHLVSLKHLEKLTKLQALSHYTVSTSDKHKHIRGFAEHVNLNNLRGTLVISHLERLKLEESEQDGHAYLKGKEHLERLTLKWNHDDEDKDHDDNYHDYNDQISLAHLEPHLNLRGLCIKGYRGTNFSHWLSSLENLVSLILYNCSLCISLPPLDQFPKLKVLQLSRLDSLEYITDEDDGCKELGLGLLEVLSISDCPKLISWWKGLDFMPLFPNLDVSLTLEGSSVKPLRETINYTSGNSNRTASDSYSNSNSVRPLSKVQWLKINNVEEQSPLLEDWLKNFVSLQYLWISEKMSLIKSFRHLSSLNTMIITNCKGVDLPSDEWEGLQSLRHLVIQEVAKLESLPKGIKYLTPLAELSIVSCPELKTLTEEIGNLKSLKRLFIEDCHKLASLPKGMINLTSLDLLMIRSCPLLLPRCQEETGDDWPQIKHIKNRHLAGTSEVYE